MSENAVCRGRGRGRQRNLWAERLHHPGKGINLYQKPVTLMLKADVTSDEPTVDMLTGGLLSKCQASLLLA